MSDVREIYELVTQQSPPKPGALDRQRHRQARRIRTRRLTAIGAVVAIGALLVVVAAVTREIPRVAPNDAPTPSPNDVLTGYSHLFLDLRTGETRPLPDTLAGGGIFFALSPDGSRFTFNSCCDAHQPGFVADVDGTRIRAVTPPGVDAFGMGWSPDGTQLVYQGRDGSGVEIGNIFVLDLASGDATRVTDIPKTETDGYWFASPTFGPNGDTVTYSLPTHTESGTVWNTWSQPIGRGAPTLLLENASYARYSPDGTQMVYLHGPETLSANELWIADADGSDAHRLLAGRDIAWPTWSPDGSRVAVEMRDTSAAEPSPTSSVYVVAVQSGDATKVAEGWDAGTLGIGGSALPQWFNNHTLILGPSSVSDEPSVVAVAPSP